MKHVTLVLLLFLSCTLLWTSSSTDRACATSLVDDSFDGITLDRCKWDESSQSGGQFTVNNQAIATTSSSFAFSIPRLTSQYRLNGDFDYQVDFTIGSGWTDPIPAGSGLEVQMAVYWDDSRYVQIGRGRDDGGEYIKPYTSIAGQGGINGFRVANSQMSGKFRLVRAGTTLVLKYHNGTNWIDLTATTVPTEDAYVYLGSISGNAFRSFTVNFDNFLSNFGQTSFHPFVRNTTFKRRSDFYVGGVVNDYLAHSTWGNQWQGVNPLDPLKENGFKWVRVGVTTVSSSYLRDTAVAQWPTLPWRDEYWSSREFSAEILRQAQTRGYRLNVFLFLSNTAAHAGQQNAPPEWAGLSVADTAQRVDQHSFETAQYYMSRGLNVEIYDIGNEIDFGVLNFRPGDRIPLPPGVDLTNNMEYMRNNVWNVEAQLLQASINGIKRANPNAKIVLHASGINVSRSNVFVKTFFKTMIDYGVQFDYAGLSNPYNSPGWVVPLYSTDCWFQRMQEVIEYLGTDLNKKVLISEASYPHNSNGAPGQAMPEFPYTPTGQAMWTREHLRFFSNQPNVLGFFWFYPDYHMNLAVDPALKGSSMFQTPTQPMPSLAEFRVNLGSASFDFDGDGKTDIGIYRPSLGQWWINKSSDSSTFAATFGAATDEIVPADFTGDHKTDIAIWRPSTGFWFILRSEDFSFYSVPFGVNGDATVPADFDNDGKSDIAVFRPSNSTWYIQRSGDNGTTIETFGSAGDLPVPADYDGDGRTDIAIYRPSLGQWWMKRSSVGVLAVTFGNSTDKLVQGDYTGDGKADNALWRPSTGEWFILRSDDFSFYSFPFGTVGDTPSPGDFDGDGRFDATVFRSSNATWYSQRTTAGTLIQQFGLGGDQPISNAFVP